MTLFGLKPWSALLLLLTGADLAQAIKWTPALARFENATGRKLCPASCSAVGSDPREWTNFQTMDDLVLCEEEVKLIHFPLYTESLLPDFHSSIKACSTSESREKNRFERAGLDKSSLKSSPLGFRLSVQSDGSADAGESLAAIKAVDSALNTKDETQTNLHGSTILSAQSGNTVVGIYIGARIDRQNTASEILSKARDYIQDSGAVKSLIGQSCGGNAPADYVAGIIVDSSGRSALENVRQSLKTWTEAGCVQGAVATEARIMSGAQSSVWVSEDDSVILDEILNWKGDLNATAEVDIKRSIRNGRSQPLLETRATCRTIRVREGDSCGALASKCNITPAKFTQFNSYDKSLCSTLRAGQPVCCSSGNLPDIRPKPVGDKCATHSVANGESCASIAASNGLTQKELESFNDGKAWGWHGCKNIFRDTIICLSKGDPPMPAHINGVACGPQKPNGDKIEGAVNIANMAKMNPCPLNACCNIHGFCGTLEDFCTVTGDKPGTVRPGTNGCISNCGTEIVNNEEPPSNFIKIAYFEAWNHDRECLHMDVDEIDGSRFTHLHFSFIDISPTFEIYVADNIKKQFERFKRMRGIKKVIAFGGWAASTSPSTYWIFRDGVKPANRARLATKIIEFINKHGLDGVDMDWEYPAAPDIPGIPAGEPVNGPDYQAFLAILRRRLTSNQSLSIAAPASYWYLKGIPIKQISKIVDYIVYMTYDLHGQWDAGNPWVNPGCEAGNCLRSHVNMTETMNALTMITKAGVPSNKVIVGVTSYGRSFRMANPNCIGVNCKFTGDAGNSKAEKGWCTDTSGYISDAEIETIKTGKNHKNVRHINDKNSESQILIWENNWVAYMDRANKNRRESKYRGLNFGGTTDWAIDLERFTPFDKGHGGIFFQDPDDDGYKPPKMCDRRSWNDEARKYMADEVSRFLYRRLDSEDGGAPGWAEDRFYEGAGDGDGEGGDPGGGGADCSILAKGGCSWGSPCQQSYARNWWVMKKMENFITVAMMVKEATLSARLNGSYYNEVVIKELPTNGKQPEDPSTLTSLLSNFGNVFGVLGGALGTSNPVTGAALGTAGAVLALTKDNIAEQEQEFQDVQKALNLIWNMHNKALNDIPHQLFVEGNLINWPLGSFQDSDLYPVSSEDYDKLHNFNRIVNFFHDRFWTIDPPNQNVLNGELDRSFKQFITNIALGEGNYYIIKGGYFENECTQQNSGRWMDGHCYTLEHKNGGHDGWSRRPPRKDYSIPINEEKLRFLEDTNYADIDLKKLYINAEECQSHHNKYYAQATLNLDIAFKPSKEYARCAWNLPVFTVQPLKVDYKGYDANNASPCHCRRNPDPDAKDVVGKHWLPKNLEPTFDNDIYCSILPPASGSRKPGPGANGDCKVVY